MFKKPKWACLAAFTVVFAVLAAVVFWGTWSADFAPVMPDCPTCHSPWWFSDWWRGWLETGRFVPTDLRHFLGSPYFWQELNYVIPLYLSGLAVAYFLRGRGLPLPACYGAGLLLSFCGYWMTLFSAGHAGWFWWMSYGPWAFGLIDRAVRKGKVKNWLLSGAVVGWGCYYQPDLWLLFTVFTSAFFIFCEIENRKSFSFPRSLFGPAIAAAAFLIVAGAGIRHAFVNDLAGREAQIASGETVANADKIDDAEKRWIFVTNWSLPFNETSEFWHRRANGDTSCPFTLALGRRAGHDVKPYTGALGRPKDAPSGNYRQHSLYVGFITCILALIGVGSLFIKRAKGSVRADRALIPNDSAGAFRANNAVVVFFAACAVVFYLLSLGRNCEPVYRVVFALPFGDMLRAPVKWHHLTEFCLVILAGFGLAALYRVISAANGGKLARFAPLAVALVALAGAIDLSGVDRLYCAPVDLRVAKQFKSNMAMTFLPREQLNHPQVVQMIREHRLVSLAPINAEVNAVAVLDPFRKNTAPLPPFGVPAALGVLSILASCSIVAFATLRPRATI